MNAIANIIETNPVAVLVDEKLYTELFKHIKAEVDEFIPDLSTAASRGRISALAYKVVRTKTAIDTAGKKLNEDARAKINKVDAQRRKVRDDLDALAERARKPLTEWEEAEKNRADEVNRILSGITSQSSVFAHDTSATIAERMAAIAAAKFDPAAFTGEVLVEAEASRARAIASMQSALERAKQAERDADELARLRFEQQERERAEREAAAAAENDRRKKAAEEATRQEEDRRAASQKAAEQAAADRARAEEKRRADEAIAKAEAEVRAVVERAAREDRERVEAAAQAKREDDARAADRKHRGEVMSAAVVAIMTVGADEDTAKKVVLAIVAGEVPNVTLRF